MDEIYRPSREMRKEAAPLEELNGPVGIRKGVQCTNWAVDQNKVIALLNNIPTEYGGTLGPTGPTRFRATRDGYCDPALSRLIHNFQQANGLGADGVVDPAGVTYPLLRRYAAGGLPAQPKHATFNETKFNAEVQSFVLALNTFMRSHPRFFDPDLYSTIHLAKFELEELMRRSNIPQQSRTSAPARNVTAVEELAVLLGLALVILVYTALPAVQKAIRKVCSVIWEGLKEGYKRIIESVADAVRALSLEAERVTAVYKSCRPESNNLVKIAAQIYLLKNSPPARVPILLEMWLKAFASLMRCLGDKGISLFEKLTTVWDLIQKAIGLFPMNRFEFLARFA